MVLWLGFVQHTMTSLCAIVNFFSDFFDQGVNKSQSSDTSSKKTDVESVKRLNFLLIF